MGIVDTNSIHNPATGTSPPAAWGDAVRDNLVWLAGDGASGNPKPMCRVYNSASQNVATATDFVLSFNSERYDVGGMHSTTTNTSRITIPSGGGGVYHIGGSVNWNNTDTDGIRQLVILLNGATRLAVVEASGGVNGSMSVVSCDYKLAASDYIELLVYQNSGSIIAVNSSGNYSPEFFCHWVGVG